MTQAGATSGQNEKQTIRATIARGLKFLASLQEADGAWRGDYGGPMFLLPMYLAAYRIAGRTVPARRREGMIAYLTATQADDGSFGIHAEASGSQFTTVLNYVAFRLLGLPADDERVAKARQFVQQHGTALACASWGKFILALLNLYEYEGLNPILPELWLLPTGLPIHPSRFWCHTRQVYLPMACLFGMKARMPADDLTHALRRELYDRPYDEIRFARHRSTIAPADVYTPATPLLKTTNLLIGAYERMATRGLRERAVADLFRHIQFEDESTHFIRIGPVNAALNTLVHVFRSPGSEAVERSFATLDGYLCDGHDGTKMNGYNSTALWDTAFAAQAILDTPEAGAHATMLGRAHAFIHDNQVLEDPPDFQHYHRHPCRGGWPFSDREHGWPISDCTGEGLTASLRLGAAGLPALSEERIVDAIELILGWQNRDGGWATYEKRRGGKWLERLNPAHVFGNIMVDYSYPECTASCLHSLAISRAQLGEKQADLKKRMDAAIKRGERFLRKTQRTDGSWEGSWGVCFTYGTWFGVRGLRAAGASPEDPACQRACAFLFDRQNPDGGWGESGDSCRERRYLNTASHMVNTAWALLTLVDAGQAQDARCRRAARFLVDKQQEDGDWPRQTLPGVFNKTTLINYENYRRYFPIWALGRMAASG